MISLNLVKNINIIKPVAYTLLALCVLIGSGYLFGKYLHIWSEYAPGIGRAKIMSLMVGQPCKELSTLLGEPIYESQMSVKDRNGNSHCDSTYLYGMGSMFYDPYEIYVNCEDGHIDRVAVEYNDVAIYLCDINKCPDIIRRDLLIRLGKYID